MTSNTPSPRIRPWSVAGMTASPAGMISPSSEASEADLCLAGSAGELIGVDVAVAPGRGLRRHFSRRQLGDDLRRQPQRIDQLAVGKPWMHLDAVDGGGQLVAGEGLVLDLSRFGAIQGVGTRRAKACDVKQCRALADLLVG